MWVAKFEFDGSEILYGKTAKVCNGEVSGYNLSSYYKNNRLIVTSAGRFFADKKNIKKAINFLKKDKHLINIEEKNGFFILTLYEDKEFEVFYSPFFIYLSPILITKEGIYNFHVASWDRKDLEKLLKTSEKIKDFKLHYIREEKLENISVTGFQPDLTAKQKQAYELAVRHGYYEYPKKITLKELARLMKVSYSTYQQHLSYAEKKLAHFFIQN